MSLFCFWFHYLLPLNTFQTLFSLAFSAITENINYNTKISKIYFQHYSFLSPLEIIKSPSLIGKHWLYLQCTSHCLNSLLYLISASVLQWMGWNTACWSYCTQLFPVESSASKSFQRLRVQNHHISLLCIYSNPGNYFSLQPYTAYITNWQYRLSPLSYKIIRKILIYSMQHYTFYIGQKLIY